MGSLACSDRKRKETSYCLQWRVFLVENVMSRRIPQPCFSGESTGGCTVSDTVKPAYMATDIRFFCIQGQGQPAYKVSPLIRSIVLGQNVDLISGLQ